MTGHSDRRPCAGVPALVIRRSTDHDRAALARLAQLDSAPPPHGGYLLAEEGGELRAAMPVDGGRPLADPFHQTDDLLAMLELRVARSRAGDTARLPGGVRVRSSAWLRRTLDPQGASLGSAGRAA